MSLRTCLATIFIIPILCASLHAQTPPHLWSQRFGNTFKDGGYGVAVDAMGNVVVTGEFQGTVDFGGGNLVSAGGSDIFVAKYDASGAHQWSQHFGSLSDDGGSGVAVDASGNVVVTGVFQGTVDFGGGNLVSAGDEDIFVAKYDANGAHQWSQHFGSLSDDVGFGVAVDASGNVVVTGVFQGTVDFGGGNLVSAGDEDIFVAKYDASGAHQWSQRFGSLSDDSGYGVAVDASGNVVVTGVFQGTVDFGGGNLSAGGLDVYVAKYDASGAHQWSQNFGSTYANYGYGVAVDALGNVVVTGEFEGTVDFGGGNLVSAGGYDIFVATYDASGAHQWSQRFGSLSDDFGSGVAVDASGNVVVTGVFQGTVDFGGGNLVSAGGYDIFVATYDASGAHQWSQRFGSLSDDFGYGVAVDASGNVVVTGVFQGTVDFGGGNVVSAGGYDIFVAKYGPTVTGILDSPCRHGLIVHSYPNPFNPAATITYSVPSAGIVDLRVYNVQGRLLKTLVNETKTVGEHFETWDGRDENSIAVASGIYFLRLESGGYVKMRKLVLIK